MKSKVQLSSYSFIMTLIINVILISCCVVMYNETTGFWFVLSILVILLFFGLLFGPTQVSVNSKYVIVKSYLKRQKISLENIKSVEMFQPTMGAYRLFASGGYFGYWGIFREGDIGKYTAYYGKASDCFLIRMKNGDKYVLGCKNPAEMVDYINYKIVK